MADSPDDLTKPADLVITESRTYSADELAQCPSCGRNNGPGRLSCVYCGAELGTDVMRDDLQIVLREVEDWEPAFNVIVLDGSGAQIEKAPAVRGISAELLDDILALGKPMPLVRVESQTAAKAVQASLSKTGIETIVINDLDLAPAKPPRRLSRIAFKGNETMLTEFNTGQQHTVANGDIMLLVSGVLSTSKIDVVEKRGRGGRSSSISEVATTGDEPVLDIYTARDNIGFRVNQAGFDFNCLGERMGLLAKDNLGLLIEQLKDRSPDAKFADGYLAARQCLTNVWSVESRTDRLGIRSAGIGKRGFSSVSSTNNVRQFTMYSRLQWTLHERSSRS